MSLALAGLSGLPESDRNLFALVARRNGVAVEALAARVLHVWLKGYRAKLAAVETLEPVVADPNRRTRADRLTFEQRGVIRVLTEQGMTERAIAARVGVHRSTVRYHRKAIERAASA